MKTIYGFAAGCSLFTSAWAQVSPTEANLRNSVATGGTITFNADGGIDLTSPLIVTNNLVIDATGHSVRINGKNVTRLFQVASGVRLTMTNLVLANGRVVGAAGTDDATPGEAVAGGALLNKGGIVTAVNCTFLNNGAFGGVGFQQPFPQLFRSPGGVGDGGAIAQVGGSLVLRGGLFMGNQAGAGVGASPPSAAHGAAIFNDGGDLNIDGTDFATNSAVAAPTSGWNGVILGEGGRGGAIYHSGGTGQITRARFENNQAYAYANANGLGGAVAVEKGQMTIEDAYFLGNAVIGGGAASYHSSDPFGAGFNGLGGALYVGTNGTTTVQRVAFISNHAQAGMGASFGADGTGFGAAIYVDGSFQAVNATFADNYNVLLGRSPPSDGSAVYNTGSVALTNVTVMRNSATGAALTSKAGSFVIKNSLFGRHYPATFSGDITDAGHNLSATASPQLTHPSSRTLPNLGLGPLGDYGGKTPTFPLLAGSPAINAADDAAAPATDQRGHTRPFGGHSDIGAFESSPPFTLFGKVIGDLGGSPTVSTNGTSIALNSQNEFRLVAPQGDLPILFSAADTVFRPNPLVINPSADMEIHGTAFRLQSLAFDPDMVEPNFTFAGRSGETWEFLISHDLKQWTPVATNTFATAGAFSMPLTSYAAPIFMKGIKR